MIIDKGTIVKLLSYVSSILVAHIETKELLDTCLFSQVKREQRTHKTSKTNKTNKHKTYTINLSECYIYLSGRLYISFSIFGAPPIIQLGILHKFDFLKKFSYK